MGTIPKRWRHAAVVDSVFAEPHIARIYDALDPDRSDLDAYLAMVEEFGARSVLDIGCGTGALACALAGRGVTVTGLDPAHAMLEVARRKPGAERVCWVEGDVAALPRLQVDMVTMTGNVAQVFLTDPDWAGVLAAAWAALRPGGALVFETREPSAQAWKSWTRQATEQRREVPGVGAVRSWNELTDVHLPFVSFCGILVFEADGAELVSSSTLRFRDRAEVGTALQAAGFDLRAVRDAPDRPGFEMVFIAHRAEHKPGYGTPPRS
jgi:ubiquinone/menaquinone biosynthesis C-methylase UbiE